MIRPLILVSGLLTMVSSLSGLPSAQETAARALFYAASDQFQIVCRLTADDGTGDKRIRELKVSTRKEGTEERFLTQVTAPASLRNLKFLRIRTKDGEGAWLKTSRGVQRLSPDGDPQPLFGSDFTTADFQPGSKDWTERTSSEPDIVTLERPTEPRMGWTKQVLTLRKSDLLILRSDFFASDGSPVRRYTVTEFSDEGRPKVVLLEDLRNKSHSELEILEFAAKKDLSLGLFAPGNL